MKPSSYGKKFTDKVYLWCSMIRVNDKNYGQNLMKRIKVQ